MKRVALWTTGSVLIACTLLLCLKSAGFISGLVFAPISCWPLLISLYLARNPTNLGSEIALAAGSLLYFLLFLHIYLDAFYWHPDAQSGIVILFIGAYSIPIMLLVWIAYIIFERRNKAQPSEP